MARRTPKEGARDLSALEKRFAAFRPASVVLTPIVAVPTRFVQLDFATRVWGWPTQRCAVVHGPSNEGKSALVLGLCGSFVEAGGLVKYDDAEHTTTADWARLLLGEVADSRNFHATRPSTFEQCVDESRAWHQAVREAREAGEVAETASGLQVVDSIRKLRPQALVAKIDKLGAEGKDGSVDGVMGRSAQIRAKLTADWLDELVPLTSACRTAWIAIAREIEDPDADTWAKKFGNDYKVQGGKALNYDAGLRCRVERESWVTVEREGKKVVLGERHQVTVLKTKIGQKKGRADVAFFHTSNGVEYSAGFDRARDVADLARRFGIVIVDGSTSWKGEKWRSFEKFVTALREADGEREALEAECRAKFEEEEEREEAKGETDG